jgi:hypothetical protein
MSIAAEKLPLPHHYRDDFLKYLSLPRRHRHRGSGSTAMDISATTGGYSVSFI